MLLAVLGTLVMGLTWFYIGTNLFAGGLAANVAKRLDQNKMAPKSALLRLSRTIYRPLVLPYSSRLKMEDWKKRNRRVIISAGLEEEIDSEELLAYKIFLGFVVPIGLTIYFT